MNLPQHATSITVGIFVILFLSVGAIADEKKPYVALEFGQITNKFTDVFDGPTMRAATGFRLNRTLGLEFAYEFSLGGTAANNFWSFDSSATRFFDDINTLSVLGTAEWDVNPRFSLFTKLGVARGSVNFDIPDALHRPTSGSLDETNMVLILGVAVPTNSDFDVTFSVKENFSANFFGLGDSFDASTVSVGLRRRW